MATQARGLLISTPDKNASHPLPEEGSVTLGQGPGCDIAIEGLELLPEHARIWVGQQLEVEALGDTGVQLNERRLAKGDRQVFASGEVLRLGANVLVVQQSVSAAPLRRVCTHDYFEIRLDEECHRALRFNQAFAVLRVKCEPGASEAMIEKLLAGCTRLADIIAAYGPSEYSVLLPETADAPSEVVVNRIKRAFEAEKSRAQVWHVQFPRDGVDGQTLTAALNDHESQGDYPGTTVGMNHLESIIERVAQSDISVLIRGETGAGKEVLAERLHRLSRRAAGPFLKLNCAAIPDTLLESSLFGHEKGSFTGADKKQVGLLESSQGGTVFLDEIGELSPALQAKLLRVLEERRVLPVGGLQYRAIDVRFVSATHRDLEVSIERGAFRQDLYFRLNGISMFLPPLRERREEIPVLFRQFVTEQAARLGLSQPPEIAPEALVQLQRYSWPGNIRELRNVADRAVILAQDGVIRCDHLPRERMTGTFVGAANSPQMPRHRAADDRAAPAPAAPPPSSSAPASTSVGANSASLKDDVAALERARILRVLSESAGNQTLAAEKLGISRRTLITRIEKYGLPRPRKDRRPS